MAKQLSEKQKAKIREASAQAKECLQLVRQINQVMDEMLEGNGDSPQ